MPFRGRYVPAAWSDYLNDSRAYIQTPKPRETNLGEMQKFNESGTIKESYLKVNQFMLSNVPSNRCELFMEPLLTSC